MHGAEKGNSNPVRSSWPFLGYAVDVDSATGRIGSCFFFLRHLFQIVIYDSYARLYLI